LSHALIYRAIKGSRETLEEARREPVEEVVENGLTGHIVASIEEATATLPRVMALDRRGVRRRFEERFTATRMVNDYVKPYNLLLARADVKLLSKQAEPLHRTAAELANEPSESFH
jgi:hypothetical protein